MKRRLLALVLCLSLLSSVTAYAADSQEPALTVPVTEGSSAPTEPTEPPTEAAEPSSDPTEPSSEPTEPTEPTEPPTEPTEPPTEPTEPPTEPTEPPTEPTEPPTEPTAPPTEPTEPPTEPTEPPTEPTAPPTEPTEPPTEPTEPPTEPAVPQAEPLPRWEKAEEFLSLMEAMPEAQAVAAFARAVKDFSQIHTLAEKDMPLPALEVSAYKTAYRDFAEAMGLSDIKPAYPDTALTPYLQSAAQQGLQLKSEMDAYYEASDPDAALSAAAEKLEAILRAYPALRQSPAALLEEKESISPLKAAPENIRMHLFNYGPQINTPLSGYGFLPFIHSEGAYGWATDSTGNQPSGSAGGWPLLRKVLQGAPYVLEDKNSVIKAGSLSYLFDPAYSGTGRVSRAAYLANISSNPDSAYNPYSYGSVYLKVNNSDGSGTGLFRKEGRYYVYDSGKNAAWYNPATSKFQLYDYTLRPAYTPFSTSATCGNFLPFNLGHTQGREDYQSQTYTKEYTYTDADGKTVEASATVAKPDTVTEKPSGARTAYRLNGTTRTSEVDLWFGMDLEFDFYQPKEGLVDGSPMVFEFLGDDDVFVFIDDVLILDIGGTHGAQAGRIDFATGKVTNPESYGQHPVSSTLYGLMKAAKGNALKESDFTDRDGDGTPDTFKDLSKHNLRFYYLERGGNISYCRLKFNMDPLPTGSVSLQKEVTGISGNIPESKDYSFRISALPLNESDTVETIPYTKYSITDPGDQQSGSVENGGSFTLGHQEKIVFKLDAGTTVTLTEAADSAIASTLWTGNGQQTTGDSITYTVTDGEKAMEYLCTNTRKTAKLTVEKVLSGINYAPEQKFTLHLSFRGTPYTGPAVLQGKNVTVRSGRIVLAAGEKILISGIPTGCEYSVTEETPDSDFFYSTPLFDSVPIPFGEACAKILAKDATLTVCNRHLVSDLVIRKDVTGQDTENTFVFRLTGGPADTALQLFVPGNGSVTVASLPVGSTPYTLKELTDWGWRFRLTDAWANQDGSFSFDPAAASLTFRLTDSGEEVTFRNALEEERWLSGDCWCENRWDGTNGSVQRRERRQ